MRLISKLFSKIGKPEVDKPAEKARKSPALSNFEKAVRLTLEKSAPCRQRRYGMKNYDMS